MVEKFTCRECGKTTYGDSYEWRDERLYLNLKKLRLCEECYIFGHNTSQRESDLWGGSQDVSTQRGQHSYKL